MLRTTLAVPQRRNCTRLLPSSKSKLRCAITSARFAPKLRRCSQERQTQHDDYLTEQIKKYQFDATRLRDARDAALAQFTENKALLDEKLTSVEACKSAVDVSQVRLLSVMRRYEWWLMRSRRNGSRPSSLEFGD